MTSNEEKIKAFLNDEKKMKALLNDEEFINKVSSEEATAETYKEEFKKFDIELSDDEANRMKDTIIKIFKTPTEELTDEFLKDVAGGSVYGGSFYKNISNKNKNMINQPESQGAPQSSSSSGISVEGAIGIGAAAVGIAWATSITGFAIAGAIYKQKAVNEWNKGKGRRNYATYKKYVDMSDKLTNILTRIGTFGLRGNVNFEGEGVDYLR